MQPLVQPKRVYPIKKIILIVLGWVFVLLGIVGVVLPILPTTPFLIVALSLFAKSSTKFHSMLLNNKWFGSALTQWEQQKTVSRQTKLKAISLVIISFSISIAVLHVKPYLQLMLMMIQIILLVCIWRIKENGEPKQKTDRKLNGE